MTSFTWHAFRITGYLQFLHSSHYFLSTPHIFSSPLLKFFSLHSSNFFLSTPHILSSPLLTFCPLLSSPHPFLSFIPLLFHLFSLPHFSPPAPPPTDSRSVQIGSISPSHISDSNGVLQFNRVRVDDGGRFTCVATSHKRNLVINATITLTVVKKPKFVVKPQNTTVKEGDSVLIDCAAEGDPTPTISVSG